MTQCRAGESFVCLVPCTRGSARRLEAPAKRACEPAANCLTCLQDRVPTIDGGGIIPWSVVELRGQANAGEWTDDDRARLHSLVDTAHRNGLWIRFYTLNGHDPSDTSGGWTQSYNFGSRAAAERRWDAAINAGVDFVAVDQYEDFARALKRTIKPIQLTGVLTYADYEQLFERELRRAGRHRAHRRRAADTTRASGR